jgi:hypothetical protein
MAYIPVLLEIAQKFFFVKTLDTRMADRLDFHTVGVGAMRDALRHAYAAGLLAAEQPKVEWMIYENDREYSREIKNDQPIGGPIMAATKQDAEAIFAFKGGKSDTGAWAARK